MPTFDARWNSFPSRSCSLKSGALAPGLSDSIPLTVGIFVKEPDLLSCAMECFERGILRTEDTGGLERLELLQRLDHVEGIDVARMDDEIHVPLTADQLDTLRQSFATARLRLREPTLDERENPTIGCIILVDPFFLDEKDWIPAPGDFSPNIVRGKGYDLTRSPGLGFIPLLSVGPLC